MITLHLFNDDGTLQHVPIICPAKQGTFRKYSPHTDTVCTGVHLCNCNVSVCTDSSSHNSHCTDNSFFYPHFTHFALYSLNIKTHYQSTLTIFINCCAPEEVALNSANSAQFLCLLLMSSHETYTAGS